MAATHAKGKQRIHVTVTDLETGEERISSELIVSHGFCSWCCSTCCIPVQISGPTPGPIATQQ
jgi:hypothetical protein